MADSTTTKSLITQARTLLHENLKEFFLETTTDGTGTTTTVEISSSIGNDYFNDNNMEVLITSGNNIGMRGEIIDWVQSTGTITVLEAFPFVVASGVTVQIGPKGFFRDWDFEAWFNDAADFVFRRIAYDKLTEYQAIASAVGTPVSGVNYGEATLPATRLGVPAVVWVDDRIAGKFDLDETEIFQSGVMVDRGWMVADSDSIFFKPKPDTTATIKFGYIPRPETFALNDSAVDWPRKTIPAILRHVCATGYFKRERLDLFDVAMKDVETFIASINGAL